MAFEVLRRQCMLETYSKSNSFEGSEDDFLRKAKESGDTRNYKIVKSIEFSERSLEKEKNSNIESMEDLMLLYASVLPEVKEAKEMQKAVVAYQVEVKEGSRFLD